MTQTAEQYLNAVNALKFAQWAMIPHGFEVPPQATRVTSHEPLTEEQMLTFVRIGVYPEDAAEKNKRKFRTALANGDMGTALRVGKGFEVRLLTHEDAEAFAPALPDPTPVLDPATVAAENLVWLGHQGVDDYLTYDSVRHLPDGSVTVDAVELGQDGDTEVGRVRLTITAQPL